MNREQAEKLFNENQGLIKLYLSKNQVLLDTYEREDIQQEANLALWKACMKFDPSKAYKFSTFAMSVIKNHFIDMIRKEGKRIKSTPYDPDVLNNE